MRPKKKFRKGAKQELKKMMKQAKTLTEYRRIQSVWLRAVLDLSAEEIAQATGLSKSRVAMNHSRYLREGKQGIVGKARGGRLRENMSIEEEETLLKPFIASAEAGGVLEVSPIREAYEKKMGREVAESTVYRLLVRHGWRKLLPRRRHPGQDIKKQKAFKKSLSKSLSRPKAHISSPSA